MKIYYWCPFISEVATVRAVINSIDSINKFSKNKITPYLINAVGEWDKKIYFLNKKKINTIKFYNFKLIKYLPKLGFIKSRISYFLIFFLTAFKLNKLIKKNKPEYLIIHLVTFVPLFLVLIFNYKTKFILRISGYPRLNFFRSFFWKLVSSKIYCVTTPTYSTLNLLKKEKIFPKEKIKYLPDPILTIAEIQKKRNEKNVLEKDLSSKNSLIAIGRLTKQKNFEFLIEVFAKVLEKYKYLNLFILGEGEKKKKLLKKINDLGLKNKVFLVGYKKNIYSYLKNSRMFVLTSLWEDPGFVLLEAGYSNKTILSSDCPNGPVEILDNNKNGFLFKSNSSEDFINQLDKILNCEESMIIKKKILFKKKCREFTLLNHFKKLQLILS